MTNHPTSCVSRAQPGLNKLVLGVATALALLGSATATASVVNFESLSPDGIYVDGDTLGEAGYTLQAVDNHGGTSGVVGLLLNGMDPTSCWLGGCPTNNTSHSYLGLNDGSVTIRKDDGGRFSLRSLDYGFVAPFGGLPNFSYGQLQLTGTYANGGTIGFSVASQEQANAWHEAGLANGGRQIEDPPGVRPSGAYLAYLRDPDGNKLCALHRTSAA
jgi:catechol 2,3-dioxygenase-like lactoylglutathione lyase family enzyme